jgi:predicted DNA-binding transcriptional regulator AlpA
VSAGLENAVGAPSQLLTPEQLAEQLGVTTNWVYARSREWISSNGRRGIPTVKLGRYCRYRQDAIDRWTQQLEIGEAEA